MRTIQTPEATLVSFTDEVLRQTEAQLLRVVESLAVLLRDNVVAVIRESVPAGRIYRIPGTKRGRLRRGANLPANLKGLRTGEYRASAPGQPPAEREGLYRKSWKFTPAVKVGNVIQAFAYTDRQVGKAGEYNLGVLLEYGTSDRARAMEPRPHVGPAIQRTLASAQLAAILRRAGPPRHGGSGDLAAD